MFTGLIEAVGSIAAISVTDRASHLQVAAPAIAPDVRSGDSVAVDGCCLTVTACDKDTLEFDLLSETVARTNFRNLTQGSDVNLERALSSNGRLGGHFVQGHIDCAAPVLSTESSGADLRLEVELPAEFAHYVAAKGSIAVNGISLTVAEVGPGSFVNWIIPHTRAHTNLRTAKPGDLVNLEFDILAKYVERMLGRTAGNRA